MNKQLAKNRKPMKTSVNGHLHKFSSADIQIEVPRGFMYDHPWFMPWWQTLIMDRAPDDWTLEDLKNLARMIALDCQYKDIQEQYRVEGPTVETRSGPKINPTLDAMLKVGKDSLSISRMLLSSNPHKTDPRTIQGNAKVAKEARELKEKFSSDDLIAS